MRKASSRPPLMAANGGDATRTANASAGYAKMAIGIFLNSTTVFQNGYNALVSLGVQPPQSLDGVSIMPTLTGKVGTMERHPAE